MIVMNNVENVQAVIKTSYFDHFSTGRFDFMWTVMIVGQKYQSFSQHKHL